MKMNELNKLTGPLNQPELMPVLFIGHGSPMNAIWENEFVAGWRNVSITLPRPVAILCISAHWETRGSYVTAMEKPKTIHDFGGFPEELFAVQYPAPGSLGLANEIKKLITKIKVISDEKWGLDHGCWSVVRHLYPDANIPVVQLSLDYHQTPLYHYELAKELASLRRRGVLIIGSGNMVHNLHLVSWKDLNAGFGFNWAIKANERMKKLILDGNNQALINYKSQGEEFNLAIPTPDHFLPLLYVLALKEENESVGLFNDKIVAGSLSMTSLKIDKI